MKKNVLSIALAAALLAACQSTTPDGEAMSPSPPATIAEPTANDCGAAAYAALVGQDKSGAPAATEARPVRVVCSTCPMTMDYNARRLNVVFDAKTGVVQKLSCG